MEFVQPIRDKKKVEEIKRYLLNKSERNYIMFLLGINLGLRISDILALKVRDVRNTTHVKVKEQKTGKINKLVINSELKRALDKYTQDRPASEFLIKSRTGKNKAITRDMAYKILIEAAQHVGLEEIGTHTMRKTFGYHFYQKEKDVVIKKGIESVYGWHGIR